MVTRITLGIVRARQGVTPGDDKYLTWVLLFSFLQRGKSNSEKLNDFLKVT